MSDLTEREAPRHSRGDLKANGFRNGRGEACGYPPTAVLSSKRKEKDRV